MCHKRPVDFEGVRILLYHEVDPKFFRDHMRFLTEHFTVISMQDFLASYKAEIALNNTFVITFDDGWKSNFNLLDILKEFKIVPTIYITGYVDSLQSFWFNGINQSDLVKVLALSNKERCSSLSSSSRIVSNVGGERDSLNKFEIDILREYVDFQPHSWSHPSLIKCTDAELRDELIKSFNLVKRLTGYSPSTFAPPFGIYDKRIIDTLKEYNIEACVSITPGTNYLGDNLYSLKRIGIPSNCDMEEFEARVSGFWDNLRRISFLRPLSSFYKQYYDENS